MSCAGVAPLRAQDMGLHGVHSAMTAVPKGRELRCHPAADLQWRLPLPGTGQRQQEVSEAVSDAVIKQRAVPAVLFQPCRLPSTRPLCSSGVLSWRCSWQAPRPPAHDYKLMITHAIVGCSTCSHLLSSHGSTALSYHSCSSAGQLSACCCCSRRACKCCLLLTCAIPCWALQNQVQQVLNVAYAMVGLANGGLGLLGDLQTIVNVDVNFPLFLGYFGVRVASKGFHASTACVQLGQPPSMTDFWPVPDTAAAQVGYLIKGVITAQPRHCQGQDRWHVPPHRMTSQCATAKLAVVPMSETMLPHGTHPPWAPAEPHHRMLAGATMLTCRVSWRHAALQQRPMLMPSSPLPAASHTLAVTTH